ncbi:cation diffusion facilitator family transporter [Eubacterium barkeri]|uniref:Cation diffusion facilitator family transporter n=1 Tax=Eubacterium barkeri TaxID=1528 RepID=A0A1H3CYF4_EUBBA|nr:cation diffusion facilitator family transporter [Eubacterium barkeri]SDX59165.1 hypothetical protein SAMN04488579_10425 [Eubacterium barkeri]
MSKENAVLSKSDTLEDELIKSYDLNELEEILQNDLEKELSDLEFLKEEKEQIGSPDALGETIKNIVWEQFLNQVGVTAGEDFIEENRGLTLDLRSEAHIQTTENFAAGKIASHNTEIDYQKRHDDWQSNFQKDPKTEHKTANYKYDEDEKVWEKHDPRSDSWKKVLNKDARADFDKNRPTGSNTANTNMDHTVSAGEIIRDPGANAHMTREEQILFANSEKNLNLMDSAANQSKGDSTMSEFLDSERNGQKAAERFDIDEEALRKKEVEARKEYEKQKKEGEDRSIKAGKKSQKEEAFRIGGNALRAVAMQLLAELVKEMIEKLINWFKMAKRNIDSLIDSIKIAIKSFVSKLKTHMVNAGNTLLTTVATAIIGPVVGTIKKVWMMLKQGWKSLKNAAAFLLDPKNKSMPMSLKLLEVGKIVMVGLSGVGALALGEAIEKGLLTIPVFAVEIPLLGSLANIVGIFMGAVVAGITGAIVINLIEKATEKKRKHLNSEYQVEKKNEVLKTQQVLQVINETQLKNEKVKISSIISDRHKDAGNIMKDAYSNIMEDFITDFSDSDGLIVIEEDIKTTSEINRISDDLDDLLNSLD